MFDELEVIYVPVLNEGTDVWRPVRGQKVHTNFYRLDASETVPDDEQWAFAPGALVRCEPQVNSDGDVRLVALDLVETNL